MKKILTLLLMAIASTAMAAGTVVLKSVEAHQRYPWNGLVDITATLSGDQTDVAQTVCTFAATNSSTGAAVPITSVSRNGSDTGSGTTWVRRFIWNATNDVGEVTIANLALAVKAAPGGVQLWENGPYWAGCNVGATKPEECGYYFWWGDTVGYTREGGTWTDDYSYSGVTWVSSTGTRMSSSPFTSSGCPTYSRSPGQLQSAGYIDATGTLVAAHDAATAHLGALWRMPTDAEFSALLSNCDTTWTTLGGVYGRLMKGRGAYASKSIFLPAAGFGNDSNLYVPGLDGNYWSSSPYSDFSRLAWYLYFGSGYFDHDGNERYRGHSVRPVRGFSKTSFGAAATHLSLDTRTGTRYARAEEPIVFSMGWNDGVTRLVLSVDGANVLTSTAATNGVYVWKPDFSTTRTVTLKHITRGTVNEALTATFTTAAYDVTFAAGAHGELVAGVPATQRVLHGEAAIMPEVEPDAGYRFTGWSAATSNVTADVTATAQYEALTYTITYENLYGATHANPAAYTVEDAVTFTEPGSIPRRQFVRWEPASIAVGSTGAVTVRAVWETIPCVYVDAVHGSDARDGSMVDLAVQTLVRAYELAEAGDVIVVAAGTYGPVTATGKTVTFRAVEGATIDGGGTSRCVTADEDVVFENLTLQNGYDDEMGGGAYGGTFDRCTITNCVSTWDGGGAYEAVLQNCLIIDNEAENGLGGGVYGGALVNCRVVDNVAGDSGGGAYATKPMLNTLFRGNRPENAAGVGSTVTAGVSLVYAPEKSEIAYTIPHDWLVSAGLAKYEDSVSTLPAKLETTYANGYSGWESYVAGLVPTNPTSVFSALVTISNGMVYVSWSPDLNGDDTNRIYKVYGREELAKGDWETPVQPWHRFFMVAVAMPTGAEGETSDVSGEGFAPSEP